MEHSPLQLMSRMASVVKGKYPATTQIDDIVEPSKENENTSSSLTDKPSSMKKAEKEKPENRLEFPIKIRIKSYSYFNLIFIVNIKFIV